jgi:hypothetical protein
MCFSISAVAQEDSTALPKPSKKKEWGPFDHKPKRAALLSLFPGAGQIYNEIGYRRIPKKKHRAWWKVPIIYGGLGACGYYYWTNFQNAKKIKEEVLYRRDNGAGSFLHSDLVIYSDENELTKGTTFAGTYYKGYDDYAKKRDIFLFASIAVYGLNIIEAFVDGHFVTFDVSQDLSFSCSPVMFDVQSPGLNMRLNFN